MTSQEIREANNSFPSKVRETYDAAANRIDELELIITRLRKALEEETENSAAYEGKTPASGPCCKSYSRTSPAVRLHTWKSSEK